MKRFLSIFLIILISQLSQGQRISDSLNYEAMFDHFSEKANSIQYYDVGLKAWIIYETKEGSGPFSEEVISRSKPQKNGDYLEYDDKQRLRIYGSYVKGKEEGLFLYFDTLGNLRRSTHYLKGLMEGEAKNYYYNGNLRLSQDYKKNLKDGEIFGYYISGARLYTGKYKKGKMLGQRWYYNEKGEPLDGYNEWFHENGVLKLKGTCINGLPEGRFTHFNDKGELELYVDYKKGLPHGAYIKFTNGKVEYKDCYNMGKYNRGANCK